MTEASTKPLHTDPATGRMSSQAGRHETWLDRLLHPDKIPPEALAGGLTPETAWQHWCADRARESRGEPKEERALSSAERWWYQRFDTAWQQGEWGQDGPARSKADMQEAEAG